MENPPPLLEGLLVFFPVSSRYQDATWRTLIVHRGASGLRGASHPEAVIDLAPY